MQSNDAILKIAYYHDEDEKGKPTKIANLALV